MKKYKSFRGKIVDMDQLRRENENTVASGNMGVNAKGDKLGKGGVVEETSGSRARKHYKATASTSKKSVSVKDKADEEKVFQDEKTVSKEKKTPSKNTQTSRKKSTSNRKERITEEGDIIIEEDSSTEDEV